MTAVATPDAARLVFAAVAGLILLLVLIIKFKVHAMISILIGAVGIGLMAGMPLSDIIGSVNEGIGNTLKGIALLVGLGSMFGAILEESGGAQTLAVTMVRKFGDEKAAWALGITGLVVAMPGFFDAGLIILIPLAFSLAMRTKRSVLYYVIPLLAGLAVGHAFIPPTPGPVLVATMLGVDLGWVILIGIFCGIDSRPCGTVNDRFRRNRCQCLFNTGKVCNVHFFNINTDSSVSAFFKFIYNVMSELSFDTGNKHFHKFMSFLLAVFIHFFIVILIFAGNNGFPPVLIVKIQPDGFLNAVCELCFRKPAQFIVNLCRFNCITHIVSLAVGYISNQAFRFAKLLADDLNDVDVLHLVVSTNVVNLTNASLVDNQIDCTAVILNIQPVTNILSIAIYREFLTLKCIVDDQRNQFLRELVWSVIITAVCDVCRKLISIHIRFYQHV